MRNNTHPAGRKFAVTQGTALAVGWRYISSSGQSHEGGKGELELTKEWTMSKYFPIALALAFFAASPALGGTTDHAAKQPAQNIRLSAAPPQGPATRAWTARKLHNSVDAPDQDCIQRAFGLTIALTC
jgi:hypothetical protein